MACHSRGEYGGVALSDAFQPTTKVHCADSVAEWRSREQLEPSPPSTSPAYWDSDDEEESNSSVIGPKPSELYGKFTWKIEGFSEISKRELRSNVFEVGGYKWYILVYPQGCDVCNHLSLFLCVADYDKLLPGWSHFAQFTIAVVNKDPKKSKYSDTLHRFCKKEHDWGWKKFMELSKVLDGFTVADTLVIKAQVQVIRENPHRPFRCLDCQYRRELVRVYLTNVEGICRRFVDEKRERLGKLMEDIPRWTSFRTFWSAVEEESRRRLAREKTDVILKAVVKKFFNEKEVTSTLVMDALYSGCKALDYRTRNRKGKVNGVEVDEGTNPIVWVDKDAFVLAGDVLVLLERAVGESLPPFKDDKGPQNRTKDVGSGDDFGKDSVERDERRLTELGRRTVEMFVLAHLYTTRVEVAYREAVALKRQEELIREEEAAGQAVTEMRIKREAAEKEKRSKKKQAKQRRKDRKEKDKEVEERKLRIEQEQRQRQDNSGNRLSKENLHKARELGPVVSMDGADDEDELSGLDTIDYSVETLGLAGEDGDAERTSWEMEATYVQSSMEASFSGAVLGDDGRNGRGITIRKQNALDDSSSTCSSDSFPSTRTTGNESVPRPPLPERNHIIPTRERGGSESEIYDTDGTYVESDGMLRPSVIDTNGPGEPSSSTSSAGVDPDTVILSLTERVRWLEQRLLEKEEEVVLLQERLSLFQHQMEHGRSGKGLGDEVNGISHVVRSSADIVRFEDRRGDASTSFNRPDGGDGSDLDRLNSSNISGIYGSNRVNGNVGLSNGNVPMSRGPYASVLSGGHDNRPSTYASGPSKLDPIRSANAPSRSRSVDFSRPPRVITPPGPAGFPIPVTGTFSAGDELGLPQHHPSTSAGIGLSISRPLSAPGSVTSGRPNIPVVSSSSSSLHSSQPLARSMSVGAGRVAGPDATANPHTTNGGLTMQRSPPVTPSYKNAAIGKTRSSSGPGIGGTHALPSYSSVSAGVSGLMSGVTMSSFSKNSSLHPISQVMTAPLPTSVLMSSPPMTPSLKMRAVGDQPVVFSNGIRGEGASIGAPILSLAPLTMASVPEMSTNPIVQESSSAGTASIGGRPPVGITFGTVTPELLQDDQVDLSRQLEHQSQQDDDYEQSHFKDQQSQGAGHSKISHQAQRHQSSQGVPAEMSEGPGLSSPRQDMPGVTQSGSINSGVALSEEFPHLDIINDLLDEDQNAGATTLKSSQHPSSSGYSRPLSLGGHKLSFGQHSADRVNGVVSDGGGDRSRVAENGEERTRDGLGDNGQVNVPFQHPPLARLHSQHNGVLDGVSSHYWPIGSSSMSSGNTSGGRNGLVDSHLAAFSLVQGHHLAVPDCSGFSLGHNGYTVYGPAQP